MPKIAKKSQPKIEKFDITLEKNKEKLKIDLNALKL